MLALKNIDQLERATEARLDALRDEAARNGQVQTAGIKPSGSPLPQSRAEEGYYGNPLLKPPVWTWQVPLYFFAGGVAGAAANIAFVAHALGRDPSLVRMALWIALSGAVASAPLLIADLGRPSRFLNMLRVFKLRSPMSVGAWTLAVFSSAVGLAVVCQETVLRGYTNDVLLALRWVAEAAGALTGLVLLSYTSVLLAVSAIPVWSENRQLLPLHFVASALGASAGILELLGFLNPATNGMAFVAAAVETCLAVSIEMRGRPVDAPVREGRVGWLIRAAGTLTGPLPLLLRIFFARTFGVRRVASVCFILGGLLSRYAWIAAGRVSARDSKILFDLQRGKT
ncbi:MAG: polysulfide reductase [Acidobacteria bacterium]|nr:MAG: polysulfide reductase [Acidobacteriota bacterium]